MSSNFWKKINIKDEHNLKYEYFGEKLEVVNKNILYEMGNINYDNAR